MEQSKTDNEAIGAVRFPVDGKSGEAAREELASANVARVGIVFAPAASTFFVVVNGDGQPAGVTVDLGRDLAGRLGVAVDFYVAPNSGQLTDALEKGLIDVAFFPVDDERKARVDFGPAYFMIETTALVHGDSRFRITSDLNEDGVRVAGIADTTTIRSAIRILAQASVVAATSVGDAMDLLRDRQVDAVVLARDVLPAYQPHVPGSRMLDGQLHATRISVAVCKGHPALLAFVGAWLEDAKASGLVRRAFDNAGFAAEKVAPAENRANTDTTSR